MSPMRALRVDSVARLNIEWLEQRLQPGETLSLGLMEALDLIKRQGNPSGHASIWSTWRQGDCVMRAEPMTPIDDSHFAITSDSRSFESPDFKASVTRGHPETVTGYQDLLYPVDKSEKLTRRLADEYAIPSAAANTLLMRDDLRNAGGVAEGAMFGTLGTGPDTELQPDFAARPRAKIPVSSSTVHFDAQAGMLVIRGDDPHRDVRVQIAGGKHVEVDLGSEHHSANPSSPHFDRSLESASAETVRMLRFDGGGSSRLTLSARALPHGLAIVAPSAEVVIEAFDAEAPLRLSAESVTVSGTIQATDVSIQSPRRIEIDSNSTIVSSRIEIATGLFLNNGELRADGTVAGEVRVVTSDVLNAGHIDVSGSNGGGTVDVRFTGSYIGTTAAIISANGRGSGQVGTITVNGGDTGRLFTSGIHEAMGTSGGTVQLIGREVILAAASIDASGTNGGGVVYVSATQKENTAQDNLEVDLIVTAATMMKADAALEGDGGRVDIRATDTQFQGTVAARGGSLGGNGGFIDVSGKHNLQYAGWADASAVAGQAGTLFLDPKNIIVSNLPAGMYPQFEFIDPHPTPTPSEGFGTQVVPLNTGNVVVTNPSDNLGAAGAGAIYLYHGKTGALISAFIGSHLNDRVGAEKIVALRSGSFFATCPTWHEARGAVTWFDGKLGLSGVLSASNSLVGSTPQDRIGVYFRRIPKAGFVAISINWNESRGAVTWTRGTGPLVGEVSASNSLIGDHPFDLVGAGDVTGLSNGNVVARSSWWRSNRGAVTWGSVSTGLKGVVSAENSLVGEKSGDMVGGDPINPALGGITALPNGNYVVSSPSWQQWRGAVTWGNGQTGIVGQVTRENSLVGVNQHIITVLRNGNYVVGSYGFQQGRGAATWCNGLGGTVGEVSSINSLMGANSGDGVGNYIDALPNGNYVVRSPIWNVRQGAVTLGDGVTGTVGIVSKDNSLVGTQINDRVGNAITILPNSNFVIRSPTWNEVRGAATWINGAKGLTGRVSVHNSLVGGNPGDAVGNLGVVLTNGNYITSTTQWSNSRGALTWGNGNTGIKGVVSAANSLVGAFPNDRVAPFHIIPLPSGNFVALSPYWNSDRGAITWGDGTNGISGEISSANSMVGSIQGDLVGLDIGDGRTIFVLSNGNYVVTSTSWHGYSGAATWGSGTAPLTGVVSDQNSLVGGPLDVIGWEVTPLNNGNYVVQSVNWNDYRGSATWGDGATGLSGFVSETNSLVGSTPGDTVGTAVVPLANGNYIVRSYYWNDQGAATWGNGLGGTTGVISVANSIIGGVGVTLVNSGADYVVDVPKWSDGGFANAGAATWVRGSTGQTADGSNIVSPQNSVVGHAANTGLEVVLDAKVHKSFIAPFVRERTGHVRVGLTDLNQLSYDRGLAQDITITPALLASTLANGTAVVLQASNDITIDDAIAVSANGNGGSLALHAGRSVLLHADITTDNGDLNVVANDRLANGVIDMQREPGPAMIVGPMGGAINTGTGNALFELRDGAGLTNPDSGDIVLGSLIANTVIATNVGPSLNSDVHIGPVVTVGFQSYSNPNGVTKITGHLSADDAISFSDSVDVDPDVNITAGESSVQFTGAGAQRIASGSGAVFGNVAHTGNGILILSDDVTVYGSFIQALGTFDANDQVVTVQGKATISGGTYLAGTALQTFMQGLEVSGGVLSSSSGLMTFENSVIVKGGKLTGEGTVQSLTAASGIVAPGATMPGILIAREAIKLSSNTTLTIRLEGVDPGRGYSQLRSRGTVDLNDGVLDLMINFTPPMGQVFEIVTTADAGGIVGGFGGLPEGTVFRQGGYSFQISYVGGPQGRSVTLTRVA